MAWQRCPQGAHLNLESTTSRYSKNSVWTPGRSTTCTQPAPSREVDDERHYQRTFREHPAHSVESSGKEKRDDGRHVRDPRGFSQRSGQGRRNTRGAVAWRGRFLQRGQRCPGFSQEPSRTRPIFSSSLDECAA